jgi:hypothetical protein
MDGEACRHPLHGSGRIWPETNCMVDLWIGELHRRGYDPRAMLGFTVTQDFEGDQFTFLKPPLDDLDELYGLAVHELTLYDGIEPHVRTQLDRGRPVLLEVDAFYLPDTRGTTYRTVHEKTTIAVRHLDPQARRIVYGHNAVAGVAEGDDCDGLMCLKEGHVPLYAEFVVARRPGLAGPALRRAARDRLARHIDRRPPANPLSAWRAAFPAHLERLKARSMAYFHAYAFNTVRQSGAGWELLASFLRWLDEGGEGDATASAGWDATASAGWDATASAGWDATAATCEAIAQSAKALQFQIARAVRRGGAERQMDELLARMEAMADAVREDLAVWRSRG